jgi:translation initiation factor 4B
LKPRTVETASAAPVKSSGSKPDPFGGAKPVDTTKVLQELEKKSDDKAQ